MYRVRHDKKLWRNWWPIRWIFPPTVDERFCRECRLPYQNGPRPKEKAQFTSGNVSAVVYPTGNWGPRKYAIKFGRWKTHSNAFFLSDYLFTEDFDSLVEVVAQAHEYVESQTRKRPAQQKEVSRQRS